MCFIKLCIAYTYTLLYMLIVSTTLCFHYSTIIVIVKFCNYYLKTEGAY